MVKKALGILAIVIALGLLIVPVYAQDPGQPDCDFGGMMGGGGMMGDSLPEDCADMGWFGMGMTGGMMGRMGMGNGMMGMMMGGMMGNMMGDDFMRFGPSTEMMGAWTPSEDLQPTEDALTLDGATAIAEAYISAWESEVPLELSEVMQFENHFYGQAVEEETGRGAFEFLIDPETGVVVGEPGPNMMWNARYGMEMGMGMGMGQFTSDGTELTLSPDEAREAAQTYLDEVLPGAVVDEDADAFYGYYTLHVLQDGETIGMLSVNGYSGQVWLHHWHGDFVDMVGHND